MRKCGKEHECLVHLSSCYSAALTLVSTAPRCACSSTLIALINQCDRRIIIARAELCR